jgi:alpha-tubulin suppressor-like RCC1 family protein
VLQLETPRTPTPPRAVTAIAAGDSHMCALLDDGGVYCWGRNDRGQCGQIDRPRVYCSGRDATCTSYEGDQHRTWRPARVDAMATARSIALGESVSCAVATDGSLRCWGYHGAGRGFGRGAFDEMRAVRPVVGLANPRSVHLGDRGGCVVSDMGDVRCFSAGSLEPETLRAFRNLREVFEGTYQVCGWDGGDSLRCNDINLELTRGGTEHARFVATRPAGFAIRRSGREVCAWTTRGRVECGGHPGGYATGRQRLVEVEGLRDVVQVVGGETHYCARTRQGEVYCWGANARGQIGDGTTVDRNVPVKVERLPEATQLVAGAFFNCALVRDGRVLCWGDNAFGQLGDGDRNERSQNDPTPVLW